MSSWYFPFNHFLFCCVHWKYLEKGLNIFLHMVSLILNMRYMLTYSKRFSGLLDHVPLDNMGQNVGLDHSLGESFIWGKRTFTCKQVIFKEKFTLPNQNVKQDHGSFANRHRTENERYCADFGVQMQNARIVWMYTRKITLFLWRM